jgi:ABC-type multidrug transport system fused ATPase/permease subunit
MKGYFRILRYVLRFRRLALLNLMFNILYALFNLFSILTLIPFLQVIFNSVVVPESAPEPGFSISGLLGYVNYHFGAYVAEKGQVQGLFVVCFFITIIFILKNICRYMALYFLAPLRNGVVRELRQNIFERMLILPLSYFSEKRKGDIIARMTTDVNEVEWSIMNTLESTFRDPLTMIFFFVAMLLLSPQLTLFVLILLPIMGIVIGRIGKTLKRKSGKAQDQLGLLLSIIEESLSGLRIIKAFNAERYQKAKFSRENRAHSRLLTSVLNRRELSSPLSETLAIFVVAAVLWYGGQLVISGDASLTGEMFIGYILIFANLINPAKSFANSYYYIQRGTASIERIEAILDAPIDIKEDINAVSLKGFDTAIEYKNVSFNYNEEARVLHNINLRIDKGKMIAIVGPSGSGKSTLADLLPRFHDATEGEILIDGHNLRNLRTTSLRNLLGIVSQDPILFNDTIFNNIAFGVDHPNLEDVIKAAKVANAHDFIMKQEKGYDTIIGDRGNKLSGGERQRLTIARAIYKNPPILILDEATSSLDTESEKLVQDALFKLMQNRTSIVIAHRLSTIQFADEIIVMQNGHIVERGNHSALNAKRGLYAKLVEMQAF